MTQFRFLLATLALSIVSTASIAKANVSPPKPTETVHFTDGATATTYTHCGDTDLCSRIAYTDGSALYIYSEGAVLCQPYFLHFVLQDPSGKTEYEFSRAINHTTPKGFGCGHTVATEMVLDHGYIHMDVTENSDGTLDLAFAATR